MKRAACWRRGSRSGLSALAFARERGLNAQRLSWWRKRLDAWEGPAPAKRGGRAGRIVAVEITAPDRALGRGSVAVVLRLAAGVTIEVSEAVVTPRWIAELARELKDPA